MNREIRYCTTEDGVRIAFAEVGEGEPLVFATNIMGDLHWYAHNPATRTQVDALVSSGFRVVRYDGRGFGSSDRDVADLSLNARVRDLEAVVDHLRIARFALCGYSAAAAVAVVYAAAHPERVSHLILVNPTANRAALWERVPSLRMAAEFHDMPAEQWDFFTLALASGMVEFNDPPETRRLAQLFRDGVSPDVYLRHRDEMKKVDISNVLPEISVPTLVLIDSAGAKVADLSRAVAARIPGASLVTTTGDYARELRRLVLGREPSKEADVAASTAPPRSEMAVILFTDIADSTALTEKLGDAAFRAKARDLDAALRAIVRAGGGSVIDAKTLGDGILATFLAASQAITVALQFEGAAQSVGLGLHVGLHAGDVIREADNVFGGTVNIASRICGQSAPGEILVSATVRDLARTSAGVAFEDRGEQQFKGVADPVRLFAVRTGAC